MWEGYINRDVKLKTNLVSSQKCYSTNIFVGSRYHMKQKKKKVLVIKQRDPQRSTELKVKDNTLHGQ